MTDTMSEASTGPALQLEDVSRSYRMGAVEVKALSGIKLDITLGEFVVILGPSGSGKTTLLNLVGGIDSPSSGRIMVNGLEISALDDKALTGFRRDHIGFVFQFFNLIPTLTARENIEFAAELVGAPRDPIEVLEVVGLRERADHFPSELSGGEQQRVAIARALVKDPRCARFTRQTTRRCCSSPITPPSGTSPTGLSGCAAARLSRTGATARLSIPKS